MNLCNISLFAKICASQNCLGQVWFSERDCNTILGVFKLYYTSSSQNLWGEKDWQSHFYYILVPVFDLRRAQDLSMLNIWRGSFKWQDYPPKLMKNQDSDKYLLFFYKYLLKSQIADDCLAFSIIYIGLYNKQQ